MATTAVHKTEAECPDGTCPLKPSNAKRVSSTSACRTCGGGPKRKLVGQMPASPGTKPLVTRAITVGGPVHQIPVRTVMPEPVAGPRPPSATSLLAAPVGAKVFSPANPGNPNDLTRVRPTGPASVLVNPDASGTATKVALVRSIPRADGGDVLGGKRLVPPSVGKVDGPMKASAPTPLYPALAPKLGDSMPDVPAVVGQNPSKVTSTARPATPGPSPKGMVVQPSTPAPSPEFKVPAAPRPSAPDYCSGPLASEELCLRGGDGSFPALSSACATHLRALLALGRSPAEIRADEICGPEFSRLIAARAAQAAATGKMPEPVAAPVKIVAPGGAPVTVDALACLRSFLVMPIVSQAMIAGQFSNYPSGAMFASDLAYGNASAAADFVEWFGSAFADQPAEVARLCAAVMNLRGVAAAGGVYGPTVPESSVIITQSPKVSVCLDTLASLAPSVLGFALANTVRQNTNESNYAQGFLTNRALIANMEQADQVRDWYVNWLRANANAPGMADLILALCARARSYLSSARIDITNAYREGKWSADVKPGGAVYSPDGAKEMTIKGPSDGIVRHPAPPALVEVQVIGMPLGGTVFVDGVVLAPEFSHWNERGAWVVYSPIGEHVFDVYSPKGEHRRMSGEVSSLGAIINWTTMTPYTGPGGAVFGQPYVQPSGAVKSGYAYPQKPQFAGETIAYQAGIDDTGKGALPLSGLTFARLKGHGEHGYASAIVPENTARLYTGGAFATGRDGSIILRTGDVKPSGDAVSDWETAAGFRQGGPGTAQDTALQPQPGAAGPSSAEIINGVSRIGTVGLGVLNNYLDSESRSHIAEVMAQASSTNEATRQAANIEIARIQSEAQVRIAALGPNATPQQQQYALSSVVTGGPEKSNTALYVGLGVGGAALLAGGAYLMLRKKGGRS